MKKNFNKKRSVKKCKKFYFLIFDFFNLWFKIKFKFSFLHILSFIFFEVFWREGWSSMPKRQTAGFPGWHNNSFVITSLSLSAPILL